MKKFRALLKVSVKSMLLTSSGVGRGKRKKAVSGVGAMLLIAFLALYLSGIYSSMLLGVLAPLNMEVLVFIFMGIGALLGGLLFTVFAVRGVVFGGMDNDLLLSMPVSSTLLMTSRVAAIYLENLLFAFFVLVPAGVVCAILTENGVGHTLLFWVRVLIAALALPLLDTALSVLLGALVAFLSTKISRGKALGQNLVMVAFLVVVFWFSFRLNGMLGSLAANAAGVRDSLTWAMPLVWMGDGILGDWGALALFVLCCVIPFGLVVFGLGKVYRRAVTAFQARSARSDYKLSAQSAAGQKKALLKKEARRFFGTPMYFWNAGLGLILLLAVSVAALVKLEALRMLLARMDLPLVPLCGAVMGFCLSTCAIAAPSVSLEGRCLWILREAPLAEGTLLKIKTGFQLLLTLPCTLVAAVCLTAALGLPWWQGAVLFAAMALFAVGHACFGMLMGLTFPKLDAANETVVVKQSLAVLLTTFVPMLVLGAAGLLCWLGGRLGAAGGYVLPLVLLAALAGVCAGLLARRGPAMLRRL